MREKGSVPVIRFNGFMDDWEWRKLGEIVRLNGRIGFRGYTEKDIISKEDGGVLTFSPTNIVNNRLTINCRNTYITKFKFEESPEIKIHNGDILFVKTGSTLGKSALVVGLFEDATLNPQVVVMRVQENDNKFVSAVLLSENILQQINAAKIGGAVPTLTETKIKDFDISIPSNVGEQRQIGTFFGHLDHLITLHQRKYSRLCNIKKSMLERMFPREGATVPEIRFAGFTDAWEQRKLSEVATMHARIGWQNLRTSEFLDSGDYMLITGTDFDNGAINYSTCYFVERERYEQDKHIQIKNGNILITKDGTLGKVAYVQGLSMPATLNAGVFNVEIKDETEVDNKYLFQYLKAPFLMDYVDKKATGGTIKHLNQNILVDFPVLMPSKAEQEEIGVYFDHLDHLITLHQRELERLQNIKKACLEKMFV